MSSCVPIQVKSVLIRGAVALALVIGTGTSFGAMADNHYKAYPLASGSSRY